MVKAVQAEESISEYFDGLLKNRVQAEVGLLVGKAGVGSRDIALAVIPSRTQDGEQALTITAGNAAATKQKKPAGKSKSNEPAVNVQLDVEAIAEHALDVSRMLPGGLSLLGVYLFAPDSGYSSASSSLCQTLATIAEDNSRTATTSSSTSAAAAAAAVADVAGSSTLSSTAAVQELLLLHVDSSSRKFTMRSCHVSSATTAASTLKPCELKFGSALSSLVCLRCSHTFDISLPASSIVVQMQQLLQDAVAAESARVASAMVVIHGQVLSNTNQAVADLLPSSTGNGASEAVQIHLYCLPHASSALQTGSSSSSSVYGSSRLHGTVEALAFLHKRDPVSKALHELKHDVVNSLKARLQLLDDEVLAAAEEAKEAAADASAAGTESSGKSAVAAAHPLLASVSLNKRAKVGMARRVLLPWSSLGLQVCCYLAEDEQADVAVEQAEQLMQLTGIEASEVLELECPAVRKQKIVTGTAAHKVQGGGSSVSCSAAVVGAAAAAAAAAAVAVGVAYINMG